MSDRLKINFIQNLVDIMTHSPPPVIRSLGVCADASENISSEPIWHGSLLYSLFMLVCKSETLSPDLSKDLPTISPESSNDDIAKANDAAARAFAYLKTELAQKGVPIQFGLDFVYPDGKRIPSPAYFVLHHGKCEYYCITPNTSSINEVYIKWLETQNLGEYC